MSEIKLTAQQATALLKAAGVEVAEIVANEADATPDFKEDVALAAIDKARIPFIKPQIEQAVKDEIATGAKAAVAGTYRSAIARAFKAHGVTKSELEKYEDLDVMMSELLAKHNATFSKDSEVLREDLKKAQELRAEEVAKVRAEMEEQVKAAKQEYIERDIDSALLEEVSKLPRIGGNPVVLTKQAKAALREKYHIHYDEAKRKIELRDKENHERPAYATENNSTLLEVADAAKGFLSELGVLATDNRHASPTAAMQQQQQSQPTQQSSSAPVDDVTRLYGQL